MITLVRVLIIGKVLEDKGVLENVLRVGGTSAGAINATLVALGYTNDEQRGILRELDFKKFSFLKW